MSTATIRMGVSSLLAAGLFVFVGCSGEAPANDCPDVPAAVTTQMVETPLKIDHAPDADFCQACVMAKAGFASCQRVWATGPDDDRVKLKKRSLAKACLDAGYAPSEPCPPKAIISNLCKGETPPTGGESVGDILKKMTVGTKQSKLPANAPQPQVQAGESKGDAAQPKAPESKTVPIQ